MIFDRLGVLRALFRDRRAAGAVAARWVAADEREPELAADVARMGGVFAKLPARYVDGEEVLDPLDPLRLARIEGRRELALELLALMKTTDFELRALMEADTR